MKKVPLPFKLKFKLDPQKPLELTPEQKKAFEERREKLRKALEPRIRACRDAEQLSAEDYMVTINARAEDMVPLSPRRRHGKT